MNNPYQKSQSNSPFDDKIQQNHLDRLAIIYVRQSTLHQVQHHSESTRLQYALKEKAITLGWDLENIVTIDDDLGQSGSNAEGRPGFQRLVTQVSLGRVGIVLEMSHLMEEVLSHAPKDSTTIPAINQAKIYFSGTFEADVIQQINASSLTIHLKPLSENIFQSEWDKILLRIRQKKDTKIMELDLEKLSLEKLYQIPYLNRQKCVLNCRYEKRGVSTWHVKARQSVTPYSSKQREV